MIPIPAFRSIDEIQRWLALTEATETNYLEFKETFEFATQNDKKKTELRQDFAAFANAHGGFVVFGVIDRPREVCCDPIGDEFLTRLNRVLSGIKPKLDPASVTIIQRVRGDNGDVIFVRVQPSLSALRPHVVAHKVYVRENGESVPVESGDEIRRIIGDFDISFLQPEAVVRLITTLCDGCILRDLSYLDRKTLSEIRFHFARRAEADLSFRPATQSFESLEHLISMMHEERNGEGNPAKLYERASSLKIGLAQFVATYQLTVGRLP